MFRNLFPLIFSVLAAGFLACDTETYVKPQPQERFYYRFVNLNSRLDPVDVRLNSTEGLEWLGFELKFEESKPSQGYSSVLVNVDSVGGTSTARDTSHYLFFEVIDNRSKKTVVPSLELGSLGEFIGDGPQSVFLIDSVGRPILIRTKDLYESPKGGKAGIRFINLNDSYVSVSLELKGDTTVIPQRNFLNSSMFVYPNAETRTVYFRNDRPPREIIDSIQNVPLSPGRVYSFYFAKNGNEPVSGYYILK